MQGWINPPPSPAFFGPTASIGVCLVIVCKELVNHARIGGVERCLLNPIVSGVYTGIIHAMDSCAHTVYKTLFQFLGGALHPCVIVHPETTTPINNS